MFACLDCYFVGSLSVHGRCQRCGSDAIDTTQAPIEDRLTASHPRQLVRPKEEIDYLEMLWGE